MKKLFCFIAMLILILTGGLTLSACGKKEYSITVECSHGTVNVDSKAKAGEIVYFDPVPDDGYELLKITVNNQEINENHFEMPAKDVVLRATFTQSYNITINPSPYGTMTVLNSSYKGGDKIYLSTSSQDGYRIKNIDANISLNIELQSGNILYWFIMPNFNVEITPVFDKFYLINIDQNIQHGSISAIYDAFMGDQVEITIQPAPNYALKRLTINSSPCYPVNNKYIFTMPDSDVAISAEFELVEENKYFNISIVQPSNGSITINKTSARYGETVIVTVNSNGGYRFKHLLINNSPFNVEDNPYALQMPNYDIIISAVFENIVVYGSFNAISMQRLDNGFAYEEVYYVNNFINLDDTKLTCGYYDSEKYQIKTVNYHIEANNTFNLETNDPYLSQLIIEIDDDKLIVSNSDVSLTYKNVEDFNMPYGLYASHEEINQSIIELQYIFQENGNIISIADIEYNIPGCDLGKAKIYGNIMIIEDVNYDFSKYEVYVGRLSKNEQASTFQGFSWDFYDIYFDEFYQFYHDPKTFSYTGVFNDMTYTYTNETISDFHEEKDKFVRLTGHLVTFGAYLSETLENYGSYQGFLYLEYLPATIEGNNISVDFLIPFSEKPLILTISAQLSEDKQILTVYFNDNQFVFELVENINFSSGTYQRTERYNSGTRIINDIVDENGNVTESIKENEDTIGPYYMGKFKVYGNICILVCQDDNYGIFVGIAQISNNNALWAGMNYYTSGSQLETREFSYNYTKIA